MTCHACVCFTVHRIASLHSEPKHIGAAFIGLIVFNSITILFI